MVIEEGTKGFTPDFAVAASVDSSLPLQPSDISDDLRHLRLSDMRQSGHVAEVPVMRRHAPFHGQVEARIAMMAWNIHVG